MSPTTTQGPQSSRFEGFTENVVDAEETELTEEMYELPPLKSLDISKGIPRYILDPKRDTIMKTLDLLPSFRPFYKMARNPLEALNTLLTQHLVGTSVSGTFLNEDASISSAPVENVYTLDSDGYKQLSYAFQQLVQAARPSFRLSGKRLPDLPYWGDFAYRAQVEHFLTRLADIHDFQANGLRDDAELAKNHDKIFGEAAFLATHPQGDERPSPPAMESISSTVRRNRTSRSTNPKAALAHSHVPETTTASLPPRSTRHLRDVFPTFNFSSTSHPSQGRNHRPEGNPSDDPGDSSDSEPEGDDREPLPSQPRSSHKGTTLPILNAATPNATCDEELFDMRLKQDIVPIWDGDLNSIVRWIKRINDLAKRSERLCRQLGSIVPRRLEGSAQSWYYSLPLSRRDYLETDWTLLRDEIASYYMNRRWMENTRRKANRASYRS
ncbi:hypothetical protein EV360DRAFT_89764 [Lentinula raphanica]|nr:hypothetical protein EV360DRAFT_89764 [Lentinula raphanica]